MILCDIMTATTFYSQCVCNNTNIKFEWTHRKYNNSNNNDRNFFCRVNMNKTRILWMIYNICLFYCCTDMTLRYVVKWTFFSLSAMRCQTVTQNLNKYPLPLLVDVEQLKTNSILILVIRCCVRPTVTIVIVQHMSNKNL